MKSLKVSVKRVGRRATPEKSTARASIDSTDLSRLSHGQQPKWYRTSAANAPEHWAHKNGSITVKRICLGAVAGVVALIALLAASGVVYTKYFGPARWDSEGWYPSRKFAWELVSLLSLQMFSEPMLNCLDSQGGDREELGGIL